MFSTKQILILFFILFLFYPHSVLASNPAVEKTSSSVSERQAPAIVFDPDSRLISVHATKVSLGEILDAIAESTGLEVRIMNEEFREDEVDVQLQDVTLKQAVNQLLSGMNAIFFYVTPYGASDAQLEPEISKVMVLSRKEDRATGPKVVRNQESAEQDTVVSASARPRGRVQDKSKDVVSAVLNGKLSARQRAVENLKADGTVKEKLETVAGLGDLVMTPSEYNSADNGHVFYESLEALKELDPESGETFLASLLESSEEPWAQSLAAENLGEWNAKNSTDSLLSAFKSRYPLVREAATLSLAKIGNSRGISQLIEAAQYADPQFQQMIASSIASSGNEASKAALSQAIDESLVAEQAVVDPPVEVLAELGISGEGGNQQETADENKGSSNTDPDESPETSSGSE